MAQTPEDNREDRAQIPRSGMGAFPDDPEEQDTAETWAIKLSNSHPGWYRIVREDANGHELGDVAEEICEARTARLLRAAPDLLEAALGVDVLYAELQAALPTIANKPAYDFVQQAVKKARAALANADGRDA